MNSVSQQEASAVGSAVSNAAAPVAPAGAAAASSAQQLLRIPLWKLRPSSRNVRKSGGTAIPELAASVLRLGLLQNLSVVLAPDGEHYEVVAGRRRLAALNLLVKRRKLSKEHEVFCLQVHDDAARTVSLTENVQREAMSPIEELFAWKDLVAEGRPVEDIAADFGVTPLVVRRRLKLANVSPRLLADFGAKAVTLEQLMALAITDDHAAQEAAFYDAPQWQRSPEALRDHLTSEEIDASRDAVARFVGVAVYELAGGGVRRDLFADERSGVFLADGALLDSLARERLMPAADEVRAEGWGWVDAVPRATTPELYQFQRVRSTRREPTKAEAKRITKLEEEQSKLQVRLDDEESDMTDAQVEALQAEMDELGNEMDRMELSLVEYPAAAMALAGAVVTVDSMGAVVVHRGLLRDEQARMLRELQAGDGAGGASAGQVTECDEPPKAGISEKLARRLSAHRTAALQAEVARHPHVALVALVHRLALRVVLDRYGSCGSPLDIHATPQDGLALHAPDIGDAPAAVGMRKVRQAWADRLPDDPDALFSELLALPQQELLSLLAVCVACTVSVLASDEDAVPAAALASAVELDMHGWWKPTAEGYFLHVSKAKALDAVRAFAPDQVRNLEKLKKADLASEAERLAAGTGWLPLMFRVQEVGTVVESGTEVSAECGPTIDSAELKPVEGAAAEGVRTAA